jgi:hypothetical protein
MAITTFATLKAAIRAWLTESSTTVLPDGTIDDLIAFCEDDLNNDPEFRLLEMQAAKLTDLNAGDVNVSLPTDYLEMQYVNETTDTARPPLTYLSPEGLAAQLDDPGYLAYYTIVGGKMRLNHEPEAGDILEMGYFAKIPALSDSQTTNWLLTKSRKTYLYGSLVYAEAFLDNDPRIAVWKTLFNASKAQLIAANEAAMSSGGTLQVGLPEAVV